MDGDLPKRKIETIFSNPSMTNIVTPTMMILMLQMIISLLTIPTMTRTTLIVVHVPVIKGGASNVSSGGLQSTPNDDYLFSPWDVWLHDTLETTSTMNYLETINHTARYRKGEVIMSRFRPTRFWVVVYLPSVFHFQT